MADKLHVTRQSVSKWEIGKSYPGIDILVQMSDLFDISLDELIKGDKELKKTIIETYREEPLNRNQNHDRDRPMNGWEFASHYWWLAFPLFGMIIAILRLYT
ncbi:transcriptional regulator [Staphylococcus aureus]|nr:transcriptional regulator [Staphylococcus aureus]